MKERQGLYVEDLSVGMTATYARTVTEADIVLFCGISGDTNPVHLDHEFAKSMFLRSRYLLEAVLAAPAGGYGSFEIPREVLVD